MKTKTENQAEQSARFIKAAREAGCSEDEAVFDAALKNIVKTRSNTQESEGVPNSPPKKR